MSFRPNHPPVEDLQHAYVALSKLLDWYVGRGRMRAETVTTDNIPVVNALSLARMLIDVAIIKARL